MIESLLPSLQFKQLKQTLDKIENDVVNTYHQRLQDMRARLKCNRHDFELRMQMVQLERQIETRIRDAFLHFMCICFYGYKQYLRPILRRPNQLSTDAAVLFEFDGFLNSRDSSYSKFYSHILRTQMFSRFIEERSFLSSSTLNQSNLANENFRHNYSLAFFDECCKRIQQSIENNEQPSFSLLETSSTRKDFLTEKTTLILPDFVESSGSSTVHRSSEGAPNGHRAHSHSLSDNNQLRLPPESMQNISMKLVPHSPMVKRSKYEREKCQKVSDDRHSSFGNQVQRNDVFRSHVKIKPNQLNGPIVCFPMFIRSGSCIYPR